MASAWRRLRVVRKARESSTITSLWLEPTDGRPLEGFRPGQFLTFRFPGADGRDVIRNYSVSSPPAQTGHYRISVKREAAPAHLPGLPAGFSSSRLHDAVAVGDELDVRPPGGRFVLEEASERTVLLLAGGVGVTPLLSMAHVLAGEGRRRCWFVHACENGDVHAFRDEIDALVASSPKLHRHFVYNRPTERDRAAGRFDAEGLLSAEMLQSFLPIDDYECYLCGPSPFMQAMFSTLVRVGVPEAQIRYEFFGPATVLKAGGPAMPAEVATAMVTPSTPIDGARPGSRVTFARSGVTATWDGSQGSILDLAESCGLSPDFSCRAGICSTCQCTLVSGEVDYFEEPLAEPEPGTALICCSRPAGDVVLDI